MSRLMSVALTEPAVVARSKTVTRRLGWLHAKPGMRLTLCRKVMGRKPGEPLMRLAEVEIVDVRRERLSAVIDSPEDVAREGFANWCAGDFIAMFCREMGCTADTEVTRIEWRYLDDLGVAEVNG